MFKNKSNSSKPAILVGQGDKNKQPFSIGVMPQERDKKPLTKIKNK